MTLGLRASKRSTRACKFKLQLNRNATYARRRARRQPEVLQLAAEMGTHPQEYRSSDIACLRLLDDSRASKPKLASIGAVSLRLLRLVLQASLYYL